MLKIATNLYVGTIQVNLMIYISILCRGHRCPHNDFKIDYIKEHLVSGSHETGSSESREQYKTFSQVCLSFNKCIIFWISKFFIGRPE